MNKRKDSIFIIVAIIILFVVGALFFLFYNLRDSKIQTVKETDFSKFALSESDFPQNAGWTLKDRSERGRTDVSASGLILGWKKGYVSTYLRGDLKIDNLDYSRVDLYISEYPPENITKTFLDINEFNGTQYDSLSDPKIGEKSKAYKVIKKDSFGVETTYYSIEFIKKDVYVDIITYGSRVDYELLKELAKKVESNIE